MKLKNISGRALVVGRFTVQPGNFFPDVPFTAAENKSIDCFKALRMIESVKQAAPVKAPIPMAPKPEFVEAKPVVAEPAAPVVEETAVEEAIVEEASIEPAVEPVADTVEEAPVAEKPARRRRRG